MIASNNRVNFIVRAMYFLNGAILLIGLGIIAHAQTEGDYRCNRINVLFDEEIWEGAHVQRRDGNKTELLIYPHFNGIYKGLCLLMRSIILPFQ